MLVPAADTLAVVIDGNLVVLEVATGRGVLLNASAALILTAFDGTVTVAQVVDQLAEETGMDATLLRSDVQGHGRPAARPGLRHHRRPRRGRGR